MKKKLKKKLKKLKYLEGPNMNSTLPKGFKLTYSFDSKNNSKT